MGPRSEIRNSYLPYSAAIICANKASLVPSLRSLASLRLFAPSIADLLKAFSNVVMPRSPQPALRY